MKSVDWPKPGYASITCSTISNIPYNFIFTTKFNDASILIMIISCDYLYFRWRMNTLVTSQYQHRLSSITKIFSRRISQSDCNIQIKLNYIQDDHTIYVHICSRFTRGKSNEFWFVVNAVMYTIGNIPCLHRYIRLLLCNIHFLFTLKRKLNADRTKQISLHVSDCFWSLF